MMIKRNENYDDLYLLQELYVEQVYADWEEQAAYLHDFMHATNPWQFFNAINGLNSYRSPYIYHCLRSCLDGT